MKNRLGNQRAAALDASSPRRTRPGRAAARGFESDETPAAPRVSGRSSADPDRLVSGDAETRRSRTPSPPGRRTAGIKADRQVGAATSTQQLAPGLRGGIAAGPVLPGAGRSSPATPSNGSLEAYGDQLPNADDFYPSPASTPSPSTASSTARRRTSRRSALMINTDLWTGAGLTDADIPTDLGRADRRSPRSSPPATSSAWRSATSTRRVGAFMAQAGGGLTNDDGTRPTADSPENVEALDVREGACSTAGVAKYADATLGAGWGGEAFGKQQAAMAIEGNWIGGAMTTDYPDVELHRGRAAGRARRARARCSSPTAGASPPTAEPGGGARPRRVPDQRRPAARLRRRRSA